MESRHIPIKFLRNLAELVSKDEKISIQNILRSTGITKNKLEDPDGRVSFSDQVVFYERIAQLSKTPGLGFRSTSAKSFNDQGVLGALLMHAVTVGEAFSKLGEYIDVVGGLVDYSFTEDGEDLVVMTTPKVKMSPKAHVLVTEETLAVWKYVGLPFADLEGHLKLLMFDYPKPYYWSMHILAQSDP